MKELEQGSPDQKTKTHKNARSKEAGKFSPDFQNPPPPLAGRIDNPERQSLPSVWDILERQVKLWAPGGPRMDRKEFVREAREVKLLKEQIEDKGTDRAKLSFALYELEKMFMRPDHPNRDVLKLLGVSPGHIFLEELHQLRSRVEAMSDEQLVDRVRWLEGLKGAPIENESYRLKKSAKKYGHCPV